MSDKVMHDTRYKDDKVTKKTEKIMIRLTPQEKKAIEEIADRLLETVSNIVRKLILIEIIEQNLNTEIATEIIDKSIRIDLLEQIKYKDHELKILRNKLNKIENWATGQGNEVIDEQI